MGVYFMQALLINKPSTRYLMQALINFFTRQALFINPSTLLKFFFPSIFLFIYYIHLFITITRFILQNKKIIKIQLQ